MQNNTAVFECLAQQKILPVLVLANEQQAALAADCFLEYGFSHLEVTLRTPAALDMIRFLAEHFPQLSVGAGTVLTVEQLQEAEAAGAGFIVSPGVTQALLTAAVKSSLPFMPGVMTPSEAMLALDYGFQWQKFFPAGAAGGTDWLKALQGPLNTVNFCATGGINPHNMLEYLSLDNVPVVGGSWLATPQALQQEDAAGICLKLAEARQKLEAGDPH